jgi:hypothetical protein
MLKAIVDRIRSRRKSRREEPLKLTGTRDVGTLRHFRGDGVEEFFTYDEPTYIRRGGKPVEMEDAPRSALLPKAALVLVLAFAALIALAEDGPKQAHKPTGAGVPLECVAACAVDREEAIAKIVSLEKKYGECELSRQMRRWLFVSPSWDGVDLPKWSPPPQPTKTEKGKP